MKKDQQKKPDLSDGEWAVLKVVWEREPVTAPDVQEALEESRGWAYSTVRTMMDRLVKKGILSAEKVRNLTLYRALLSREMARRSEITRTLKRAFDGAMAPMMECLLGDKGLTAEELARIEDLLQSRKQSRGRGRGK